MSIPATIDLVPALRALRARCTDRYGRSKLHVDGIWLVNRFRYQPNAAEFARMVEALGGLVVEVCKTTKVEIKDHQSTLPIRVVFTVGIDADLYLEGKATIRDLRNFGSK